MKKLIAGFMMLMTVSAFAEEICPITVSGKVPYDLKSKEAMGSIRVSIVDRADLPTYTTLRRWNRGREQGGTFYLRETFSADFTQIVNVPCGHSVNLTFVTSSHPQGYGYHVHAQKEDGKVVLASGGEVRVQGENQDWNMVHINN